MPCLLPKAHCVSLHMCQREPTARGTLVACQRSRTLFHHLEQQPFNTPARCPIFPLIFSRQVGELQDGLGCGGPTTEIGEPTATQLRRHMDSPSVRMLA